MERAISEYESAEDLEENPEERAEEFDTPEEKIKPKTAEKKPNEKPMRSFEKRWKLLIRAGNNPAFLFPFLEQIKKP